MLPLPTKATIEEKTNTCTRDYMPKGVQKKKKKKKEDRDTRK